MTKLFYKTKSAISKTMYQLSQTNITHLSCLSKIDMCVSITVISRLTFLHANNLCLQTSLSVYDIQIQNEQNPFIIHVDTFSEHYLFSIFRRKCVW